MAEDQKGEPKDKMVDDLMSKLMDDRLGEVLALAAGYVKMDRVKGIVREALQAQGEHHGMGALVLSYLMHLQGKTEIIIAGGVLKEYSDSGRAGAVAILEKDGVVTVKRLTKTESEQMQKTGDVPGDDSQISDSDLYEKVRKQGYMPPPGQA